MADEPTIDYSQFAAELVTRLLSDLYSVATEKAGKVTEAAKLNIGVGFNKYLEEMARRYSTAKTFFYQGNPQNIYSFYVPQDLKYEVGTIEEADTRAILAINQHAIITGSGGSGKSILARHLFLDTLRHGAHIPVFVALRDLNETPEIELVQWIYTTLSKGGVTFSPEIVLKAMERGLILLIADGFDEVERKQVPARRKQIIELTETYGKMPLIATSRPDREFAGWPGFTEFKVEPFSLEKVKLLVSKLRFDEQDKIRFLTAVETSLYKSHSSFLSNPLLLTIMLLTYSQNASVPTKNHLFYGQVFDTLWSQHDALKGGYERDRFTTLQKDDFLAVLNGFAAQTYFHNQVTFDRPQALKWIARAAKLAAIEVDPEPYLQDLLKSVCVLVEEGLAISFTHRSFQEYYTACFLATSAPGTVARAREKLADRQFDSVVALTRDMNPDVIDREYFKPALEAAIAYLKDVGPDPGARAMAVTKFFCQAIQIHTDNSFGYLASTDGAIVAEAVRDLLLKRNFKNFERKMPKPRSSTAMSGVVGREDFDKHEREILTAGRHTKIFQPEVIEVIKEKYEQIAANCRRRESSIEAMFEE